MEGQCIGSNNGESYWWSISYLLIQEGKFEGYFMKIRIELENIFKEFRVL